MNARSSMPPIRNLPPGRLAHRREHLLKEIRAGRGSTVVPRWRTRAVVIAAAVFIAVVVGASALAYRLLGPSPGFTAGVSAFERLPQAEWPSSIPRVALEHSAPVVGLTPDEAEARLRLLQTNLRMGPGRSEGRGSLYAYPGRNGTACMFLTGQGGSCVTHDAVPFVPSAKAMFFPGYPGQTPSIDGIVADNVRAVRVVAGDRRWPVEIVNNSFYSDIDGLRDDEAVEIAVRYADDSTRMITVRPGR